MIKAAIRPNLKYPLQLLLYNELRNIETILVYKLLKFGDSLVFTPLMFLGEFLSGLIIYLYQKKLVKKNIFKVAGPDKYMNLELIKTEQHLKKIDSIQKIIFILFCCALFDLVQFVLAINTPQFINVSASVSSRMGGFLTIFDALFYYFILRLPIFRHQFFCLIIIGICIVLIIIFEFIFQEVSIFLTYGHLCQVFLLSFICQFFNAMTDSNEKYLFEYDNVNPFYALMFEGFFGFLFSFCYCLYENPFKVLKDYKNNKGNSNFGILIFCLIIFIILSGLKNSFRVITTKVYTPMTTTSLDYILNPIYMSIDFALQEDFLSKGERNYAYFFINLIISLIISFLGLVYNEFLILFFCHLDKDTHLQISRRGNLDGDIIYLEDIDPDDD